MPVAFYRLGRKKQSLIQLDLNNTNKLKAGHAQPFHCWTYMDSSIVSFASMHPSGPSTYELWFLLSHRSNHLTGGQLTFLLTRCPAQLQSSFDQTCL